jgi:beta-lactamase superfamily II metal-dependent hydrolase
MIKAFIVTLGLLLGSTLFATSGNLEIYWVDADGGAATLIVAPSGKSLLVDTANRRDDNSDANRILAAAKMAGLERIDILLTTHYHGDHMGGMAALATMIPIAHYMDHGPSVELDRPRVAAAYEAYEKLSSGKRTILKAGDKIPLQGLDITVVQSAGKSIATALAGAGAVNASCASFEQQPPDRDADNDQSVGILVRLGDFDFLDLGDLTWNYEKNLVCPANLIGKIDVYQTTHHGLDRSNSPQMLEAIDPVVIVMNNGATKGGPASVFETFRRGSRLEDIWQGHLALRTPVEVNTNQDMIANLGPTDGCEGHMLKLSVAADGSYSMTNLRNRVTKSYQSK